MFDAPQTTLRRDTSQGMIAGVCVTLAQQAGLDVTLVRLLWVAFTLAAGSGVMFYLIAWAVIPDQNGERTRLPVVLLALLFAIPIGIFALVIALAILLGHH